MKRALKILLFFGIGTVYAQEKKEHVYSVYFTDQSLEALKTVPAVSESYYARYKPEATEKNQVRNAAGEYLHVDQSGIYLEKNKLLFITREQVREEGKYQVRDGYLFGVVENDSVPTALEGENYYFLIPSKTYLYGLSAGSSTLYAGKSNGEYLLVSPEPEDRFSAIYFRFTPGYIMVMELVLNGEFCNPKMIDECETIKGDFNTYILNPTEEEWQSLFGCFVTYDTFVIAR